MLITDLGMPGLDGVSLATRVRHLQPDARIVATTAAGPGSLAHLPPGLFDALLTKPGSLQQMQDVLARFGVHRPASRRVPPLVPPVVDPFEEILLEAFRQSWPEEKRKLQQAIQARASERVVRILHRLQGGLQAMGRDQLAARCVLLQQAVAAGDAAAWAEGLEWMRAVEAAT